MIGRTAQKWLKGLHLLAVACWVGGGVSLLMLYFLKHGVDDGGVLYGMNRAIHHVDMAVVVIPGAFGCLLTGLAYSLLTGWGFFRHGWLILKWVATLVAILFGTFFLGPWETAMMDISGEMGIAALDDPAYLANQRLNFAWGTVQVAALVALIWISIFKPWKNVREK
ncbi:DUF2269 family protein [Pseudodesulfovibrio sp. F-1]|uniref:DUF2269 family protein n=1 Tax=Pseudodesulfovibrio alkaliphilus TaxID=2661613 RepID=A0A7K1KPD9_9BACT|nr:DUF2269 family protein [Pseudodesulfovibrio alkaliphilus]MUM77954.1 DUF2269 family protein [Pseudodesulfovibrio alkaliphilus]